jgi:hypothetical protein
MDRTGIAESMINLKPKGKIKRGRPGRTWNDGMYRVMSERGLRMGEWNSRREWNIGVGRGREGF